MAGKHTNRSAETARAGTALQAMAEQQHGVVSLSQLRALGLSDDQVATRVRDGWLHRIHRGVYGVGQRRLTRQGWWMAAVMAGGNGALLSHSSAALLWEIWPVGATTTAVPRPGSREAHPHSRLGGVEITIPHPAKRRRTGLIVHRCSGLLPSEQTRRNGIPVTATDRTILDLASRLGRRPLERMIDEAERLNLCTEDDLNLIVAVHPRTAGVAPLRDVLLTHIVGSTVTRSELEERFLALCRDRGLPQPVANAPLLDYHVDFLWPTAKLVVEVDGLASHRTRKAFHVDRDRDSRLAVAGYRVLRFTWHDVTRRPAIVAHRVRAVLRQAP